MECFLLTPLTPAPLNENDSNNSLAIDHYFAQRAFENGASTDRIAKTLGHATSPTTEETYLHREMKKEFDVSDYVELTSMGDLLRNDRFY